MEPVTVWSNANFPTQCVDGTELSLLLSAVKQNRILAVSWKGKNKVEFYGEFGSLFKVDLSAWRLD